MPIKHSIKEGESVTSLADQFGHFVDTIWNDPANGDLKQKRKNMDILMPGDVLAIPDKRLKEVSKSEEQKHRFRRKGVPALLRLQIFDRDRPRASEEFTLTVDGRIHEGKTDREGVLQVSVPTSAREAHLVIGPDRFEVRLKLGELDPENELSGIQKRLNNLGFNAGKPDGQNSPQTESALRAFQRRFGLAESGKADEATTAKLKSLYDEPGEFPP